MAKRISGSSVSMLPHESSLGRRREFGEVIAGFGQCGIELQGAEKVRSRSFGLAQCLKGYTAIVDVLWVHGIERQRTSEFFQGGLGLALGQKNASGLGGDRRVVG